MKIVLLATLLSLAGCVAPLLSEQRLSGTYRCRETGDVMIFRPDGTYDYSIQSDSKTLWRGRYCYDPAPSSLEQGTATPAELQASSYNYKGGGLRFTYARSGHCYPDGKPLWGQPRFPDRSRRTLQILSVGRSLHYDRETP